MAYQIYKIHLVDGSIIEVAENYYTLPRKGLIAIYQNADDNEVIAVGDAVLGACYIPKNNILYISAEEVKVVD